MATTEETAIDEKKGEETKSPDFKSFFFNYIFSILFTIGITIFVVGSLGLYTTKVAQANILPDNIELAPFTIYDRVVNDIPIPINVMKPSLLADSKNVLSQKAIFHSQEYLDSFSNSFLCGIKKMADPKSETNIALFFSTVYENMVAKNFLAINTLFFYLSYLPESVIMLLYGFFGIFIWIGLYFFNMFVGVFYHLINIPELFRRSSENKTDGTFQWEPHEKISFFRVIKFLMFFFIWFPVGVFSAFLSPLFFTFYGLLAPLFATYSLATAPNTTKGPNTQDISHGVSDFVKDTFVYKKFMFLILATLSLFSNGYTYLGANSVIGIVIAVVFAYFMGLYKNELPTDGFTSKIRDTMLRSKVNLMSENVLVEICKQNPTLEEKAYRLWKRGKESGTMRRVSK